MTIMATRPATRSLRAFAVEGSRIVRATDTLGRWGGEEFMLLMPDSVLPAAGFGAERLRQALEKLEVDTANCTLKITLSAGVVQNKPHETSKQMIDRADAALYRAKADGRNQVATG
jgi:diguanylate cyclase (GGDEF)-like protein